MFLNKCSHWKNDKTSTENNVSATNVPTGNMKKHPQETMFLNNVPQFALGFSCWSTLLSWTFNIFVCSWCFHPSYYDKIAMLFCNKRGCDKVGIINYLCWNFNIIRLSILQILLWKISEFNLNCRRCSLFYKIDFITSLLFVKHVHTQTFTIQLCNWCLFIRQT